MRPSSAFALLFSVSASCQWGTWLAAAALVNVTVDDTDPSILFEPTASWHASSDPSATCLKPNSSLAYNGTWHEGTHTSGADSGPKTNASDPGDPFHAAKFDRGGFVDELVTVQLNFTGSAVYLYCIQPLHVPRRKSTPTLMNLTFTLDGHITDQYIYNGSRSTLGFSPHINVFSRNSLSESPHRLQVNIEPDSVFLFDYMQYSQTIQDITITTSTGLPVPTRHAETSAVIRHETGTFAGAVGGSVGVLTIFALGLAFNLYRRRRLAARRDRDRRQGELLNGGTEQSPMYGPAPFVPRYFPGTVPAAPPPYVSSVTDSETVPYDPPPQHPSTVSYADLPPPLDDALSASPPPFVAAIALPVVAVPPDVLPRPGIPVAPNRISPPLSDTAAEDG